MAKNRAALAALLAFLSVILNKFFSDQIAQNYPGTNPTFVSALGAAITALVIYYLFRKSKSAD